MKMRWLQRVIGAFEARGRRQRNILLVVLCGLTSNACAPRLTMDITELQGEVMAAERAFARSMAERDPQAFATLLADDAIFFSGSEATRGKAAVAAAWAPFFVGPDAPFSWDPDQVEVVEAGDLALSTGPVYDPSGTITGRFNSIWRREAPGIWRVVFDKGSPVCNCSADPTP